MPARHDHAVRVGIIDVGSNTVRLHAHGRNGVAHTRRAMLRLGEAIEQHGTIPEEKLAAVAGAVADFAADARRRGTVALEVLVTSPGRQAANADELVERLAYASRAPVRVLPASEEGRLAFVGAVASIRGGRRSVAVCDVGGGSAQVAVGTRREGPAWVRSIDIGSMRLTTRLLPDDPPGARRLGRARAEVERYLDGFVPPLPQRAVAVGGSARALARVVGPELGGIELAVAIEKLGTKPVTEVTRRFGIDDARARTLPAGAVILAALQARLGVPLRVARAGLREGAAAELEARLAAAA
jgi:exopolyphosphatase/guanosine-5'-triphosphate,3'-diphosphate pyrophosphatase